VLYHQWKSAPETIAYLQNEADHLALEIGDYLTALNEVLRRYSRRHTLRYWYTERPDPVRLYETLRIPRESNDPVPIANACVQILTPDSPNAIAYYVASKRLGLEVEFGAESLLARVFGEPEGCSSALRIKVATEPLLEADLFLVHGYLAGRYEVRAEHTAYIFLVESSNVPVPKDPIAHALFLKPPLPCRPEDYTESYDILYSKLLPGINLRESLISRDSILIPSFSGRAIHWWLNRPLTACEMLQAKGFTFETAKYLTERFARRYLKIDIDPITAGLQIQSFLRAKGIQLDGEELGNNAV
jgi:hypothetical protein